MSWEKIKLFYQHQQQISLTDNDSVIYLSEVNILQQIYAFVYYWQLFYFGHWMSIYLITIGFVPRLEQFISYFMHKESISFSSNDD